MITLFTQMEQKFFKDYNEYLINNHNIYDENYGMIDIMVQIALFYLSYYKPLDHALIFSEIGYMTKKYIGVQEVKRVHYLLNQSISSGKSVLL